MYKDKNGASLTMRRKERARKGGRKGSGDKEEEKENVERCEHESWFPCREDVWVLAMDEAALKQPEQEALIRKLMGIGRE